MKKFFALISIFLMLFSIVGCSSESTVATFDDVSVTLPSDGEWEKASEDDSELVYTSEKYGKVTIGYEEETEGFTVGELLQPYTTNDYDFQEITLNGYDAAYNIMEQGLKRYVHAQMLIDTENGYYYEIYYISADGMDNSDAWNTAGDIMKNVQMN